ncbi:MULTISPECIES: LuxR C-terminal-related transcriptional regulator [Rhodococcus]|jgi:DNA-binding CsgD family transcriptional regulator|uniref:LuxR C-terminal-related transcriptional regulator n=1 Tax=Rhodococcus oxybenzonivorans TaxID=1990687 RepID=A0A2S2C0J0_9NOCA|nr:MULTISPECIES: LuxR C-terminal-related transcriptional regulator [Rhodococcus]AWK74369.1 LuxR family transcriptional regulator [Rhodococcus oxybenzonivorans]MDV7243463.1 LuxR C-terminal-related transcriptional regulator [Rhodococcus oxybenzonivorans]MDV7265169.1 LuxR C-terminal-related transcriptional regulator [Rhodococcus oxybenzonivorans]MDV7277439.1 LuxR C-terminal-related transcriptional regulator [Rhodococcus oxybenzonivorans]MDV7335533.1 LuxR C-terminal-related transcriptional regulat
MTAAPDEVGTPSPPTAPAALTRPALSAREVEVLRHWLRSDSKLAVAGDLHIALGTVNTHLSRIREKYALVGRDATTKTALLVRALQDDIITIAEL